MTGAALLSETLRLTFSLPRSFTCPIQGCRNTVTSKKWTSMKGSLTRHLNYNHKLPNRRIELWCAQCGRIRKKPTFHPCLANRTMCSDTPDAGSWPCSECGTIFTTKVGLLNHEKTHKRQAMSERMPALQIPEGPARRRTKRNKKLATFSSGDPGDMHLAPPPSNAPDIQDPSRTGETSEQHDYPSPRGRIDLQTPCILASFIEPLNTLLEVDEIGDARVEEMVQHIISAVQEYFHLQRPVRVRDTNGSSQRGLDILNPQRVQQTYKWNRRKCNH
ncbi:c2H2-type domain-containing protein [Trichonephila clavipes]|nr:c2H2-type domain-containing protein [Trichonephila clavipes]